MLWRVGFASVDPNYVRDLLPSMILGGTGVGLALGTVIAAGVTSLPANRAATGSALINANRQITAALGVAVLVTLLGERVTAASLGDFRAGWVLAAIVALLTAGTGFLLLATVHMRASRTEGATVRASMR
jgi:hypothetical protein